jgi:hypothetical protein
MTDFIGGGVFVGSNPQPVGGRDLGELGGAGSPIPGGFAPSTPVSQTLFNPTNSSYWAKVLGVVSPSTIGDAVAVGRDTAAYNAKLSVEGDIYALGFILSDTVRITKDGGDNLVFTDPVSGSKTLAQIIAAAGGDVHASGTPTNLQLAQWINATTIQGIAISSLVLTQSQITGLVTALGSKATTVHSLINTTNHPVTGLTAGHFLKALSPTSYGFAAHGLTATSVGLGSVTNNAQVKKIASATNFAVARWNGTTGDLLKDSSATVDDLGNVNIPTGAKYKINGVPISLYGGVAPFHVQAFATPTITLDGATYKDFIIGTITGATEINITGLIDGDAGQINIVQDGTGHIVTLGAAFTKQLGTTIIDNTANADNFISFRKVGSDLLFTISQVV